MYVERLRRFWRWLILAEDRPEPDPEFESHVDFDLIGTVGGDEPEWLKAARRAQHERDGASNAR